MWSFHLCITKILNRRSVEKFFLGWGWQSVGLSFEGICKQYYSEYITEKHWCRWEVPVHYWYRHWLDFTSNWFFLLIVSTVYISVHFTHWNSHYCPDFCSIHFRDLIVFNFANVGGIIYLSFFTTFSCYYTQGRALLKFRKLTQLQLRHPGHYFLSVVEMPF